MKSSQDDPGAPASIGVQNMEHRSSAAEITRLRLRDDRHSPSLRKDQVCSGSRPSALTAEAALAHPLCLVKEPLPL